MNESISLPSAIERDCLRVIAYFAYFHYPVTAFEVWKWLLNPVQPWSYANVRSTLLTSPWLRRWVAHWRGMYGFGDIVAQCHDRHVRLLDALRKYRKLRWVAGYIGRLPYVEGIAVCNSLALHYTKPTSDIDLLIITKPERVWTVRFLAVSAMALLRTRPGESIYDPVCCSFFVDRQFLHFDSLRLSDDPYFAYWTATLLPVVDRGTFTYLTASNPWLPTVLPHARLVQPAPHVRMGQMRWLPAVPVKEGWLRQWQEQRFPERIRALKNVDTRVVINNKMLKFHENDRRAEIAAALQERMTSIV